MKRHESFPDKELSDEDIEDIWREIDHELKEEHNPVGKAVRYLLRKVTVDPRTSWVAPPRSYIPPGLSTPAPAADPSDPAAGWPQPAWHANFADTPSKRQIPSPRDLQWPSIRHNLSPEDEDPILTNAELGEPVNQQGMIAPLGHPDILSVGPPEADNPESDLDNLKWLSPDEAKTLLDTQMHVPGTDPSESYKGGPDNMRTRGKYPRRHSEMRGTATVTTGPINPLSPL
jgi:hypothetical protein